MSTWWYIDNATLRRLSKLMDTWWYVNYATLNYFSHWIHQHMMVYKYPNLQENFALMNICWYIYILQLWSHFAIEKHVKIIYIHFEMTSPIDEYLMIDTYRNFETTFFYWWTYDGFYIPQLWSDFAILPAISSSRQKLLERRANCLDDVTIGN